MEKTVQNHCLICEHYPDQKKIKIHQERKRIAEDLHDEVGPMLAGLKLRMLLMKRMQNPQEISTALDKMTTDIDFLIHDVRKIIRNINPAQLEDYGLINSIEDYRDLIQKNNIHFDFRFEGIENHIKEEAGLNIYRVIMELINNSIKHSRCKTIKLIIKTYPSKTIIVYSDDGCQNKSNGTAKIGMGLKSIEARVKKLKGEIIFNDDFHNGSFCQILFDNNILLKK